MKRGLQQGDPLSPFLFLIVAEGLNMLMRKAVEEGFVQPTVIGKEKVAISHFQYADDTLFLCDGGEESLKQVKRVLRLFELSSGLKDNFGKSCIYGLNATESEMGGILAVLGCEIGRGAINYLGMNVGNNHHRNEN
ncbi:hypothetical protein ACS0TY_034294 [Phlomoides rotata]